MLKRTLDHSILKRYDVSYKEFHCSCLCPFLEASDYFMSICYRGQGLNAPIKCILLNKFLETAYKSKIYHKAIC